MERLVVAVDVALVAHMRIVDVVARGAVEEFDAVVQRAADQEQRLHQAAGRLERLLVDSGRADEARAFADEVINLLATTASDAAGAAGSPPD